LPQSPHSRFVIARTYDHPLREAQNDGTRVTAGPQSPAELSPPPATRLAGPNRTKPGQSPRPKRQNREISAAAPRTRPAVTRADWQGPGSANIVQVSRSGNATLAPDASAGGDCHAKVFSAPHNHGPEQRTTGTSELGKRTKGVSRPDLPPPPSRGAVGAQRARSQADRRAYGQRPTMMPAARQLRRADATALHAGVGSRAVAVAKAPFPAPARRTVHAVLPHGSPTFFTADVRPVPARAGTAWGR